MSMEINGSWRHYETNYAQQMNAAQRKAKEPEKCTGSTDRVDREIEKLKEQKKAAGAAD